ncbi:MAG: deoxyribodipyrimidine photo-lyase [Phycisphaerae bacterium]|nr:deoxyribodipyrimidine photo-lyase [Phycisphaerae bacterium]
MTTILWFRQDLRTDDNPALLVAAARGPVIPVYLWAPEDEGEWPYGGASRWWLHHALAALETRLAALGSRLVVRTGRAVSALPKLLKETGATRVVAARRYEPAAAAVEAELAERLGPAFERVDSSLLHVPESIRTGTGLPYQVYTPFAKNCRMQAKPPRPQRAPSSLEAPPTWPRSEPLDALGLLPTIDWAAGMRAAWTPGETGALAALRAFVAGPVARYALERDLPAVVGTSRLSPHLHFGEISPRRAWYAVEDALRKADNAEFSRNAEKYLAELLWREFGHHVLVHFPHTPTSPLRAEYAAFPWRRDKATLRAWQRGVTGYPLVDAGMRELWATGWMHNRVRMVVASFLVKHLLHSWLDGARWFWDTLVDADLANNTLGWQWAGGCGADAAPYFRIFNPVLQGEKFDTDGAYVRRWVPEIARLPNDALNAPWKAPSSALARAGVTLGVTYPQPIVAHDEARERALAALAEVSLAKGARS